MTIFSLIVGIILGAVTVVFALQNIVPITVTFFSWHLSGSLALVLVLAALIGVIICALFSIPEVIETRMRLSALKSQNKKLEDELATTKKLLDQSVKPLY